MTAKIWITTVILIVLAALFLALNPPPRFRSKTPSETPAPKPSTPQPRPPAPQPPQLEAQPMPIIQSTPQPAAKPLAQLQGGSQTVEYIPHSEAEWLPSSPGLLSVRIRGQVLTVTRDLVSIGLCPQSNRFTPGARCASLRAGQAIELTPTSLAAIRGRTDMAPQPLAPRSGPPGAPPRDAGSR